MEQQLLLLSMLIKVLKTGVPNNLVEAYKAALHADTTAFGGIVAVNQIIDEESARKLPRSLLKRHCSRHNGLWA